MIGFALSAVAVATPDFDALDGGIERCDRAVVLPVFASEEQRRSQFITAAYQDQAAISAERLDIADRRRALREAAAKTPKAKPVESDQELSLMNLALDDRQRALDDRRRLEQMRQDAINVKRRYFIIHCASAKDDK